LAAHRQALAILEEIAPDDLAWIAMCLANIYVVLDSQGRYQEALQMAERQMGLFRRAFGEDHPESLGAVNNLGVALLRVGRASDAFDTFVELRERMRGREVDASALANTLNNIGLAQHDLGRYRAALRSYQEALQIKRREFGERHFSVAETLVNVAATSARQGRHREAIEHNRHAIAIWRDVYGEDHIEVAGAWSAIGTSLARLRRSDEAREAFVKALEIYKNAGHDDHPDARDTVQALRRLDRR
jgi:tetratricopeptide (TPR) repeat protein